MKCVVDRKALRSALTTLKACLPEKPLTEMEGSMLLKVSPAGLAVIATDMLQEGAITVPLKEESESSFEVLPDMKKLEKVLTKTDFPEVTLEYETGSGALRVSGGSSGFVDIPTFPAAKLNRYDAPVTEGDLAGIVPADMLSSGLSYICSFLPESIGGNQKFEVAILENGILSGANGWNRRGYFVSKSLILNQEVKFLQRFTVSLSKVLKHVVGDLSVTLHERSIILTSDSGFKYTCVRARHETPDPVLSYLQSSDPYLTMDLVKLVKALDKVSVPDYSSAGAAVGVHVTIAPADGEHKSKFEMKLASLTALQAADSIPCTREAEKDGGPGELVEKVIDYRMFKEMASEFPSAGDTRVYMSNPASRFFKFHSKFSVGENACVAVAVGSYSKVVANGMH